MTHSKKIICLYISLVIVVLVIRLDILGSRLLDRSNQEWGPFSGYNALQTINSYYPFSRHVDWTIDELLGENNQTLLTMAAGYDYNLGLPFQLLPRMGQVARNTFKVKYFGPNVRFFMRCLLLLHLVLIVAVARQLFFEITFTSVLLTALIVTSFYIHLSWQ